MEDDDVVHPLLLFYQLLKEGDISPLPIGESTNLLVDFSIILDPLNVGKQVLAWELFGDIEVFAGVKDQSSGLSCLVHHQREEKGRVPHSGSPLREALALAELARQSKTIGAEDDRVTLRKNFSVYCLHT